MKNFTSFSSNNFSFNSNADAIVTNACLEFNHYLQGKEFMLMYNEVDTKCVGEMVGFLYYFFEDLCGLNVTDCTTDGNRQKKVIYLKFENLGDKQFAFFFDECSSIRFEPLFDKRKFELEIEEQSYIDLLDLLAVLRGEKEDEDFYGDTDIVELDKLRQNIAHHKHHTNREYYIVRHFIRECEDCL